jgi:geranylgeranyl reductase family protein
VTAPGASMFLDQAEIVVIGSGPAGASAAAVLAEYGHDVLLVDKDPFPRDKPCGDGLTRAAVAFIKRRGLGGLIAASQSIEGGRAVFGHGREELKLYRGDHASCVPRLKLDMALRDAALGLGARAVTARVTRPIAGTGGITAVEVRHAGQLGRIGGKYFVAADGPNSTMRQRLGLPRPYAAPSGYAVRQYFKVERALDPLFDVYLPLAYRGTGVVGYGWVFPVSEHRANIGVGYYRSSDPAANPSIRDLLLGFVDELRRNHVSRFGELIPVGRQFGSPLGVHFAPELCEWGNVLFAGDSARMTDPFSGEGISIALQAGEELARHLHELTFSKAKRARLGEKFARISPRLGQNMSMLVSVAGRALAESPGNVGDLLGEDSHDLRADQPFLCSARQLLLSGSCADSITCPPEMGGSTRLASALDELDRRAQAELRTTFPFIYEMVHRRLHAGDGPMLTVALLSSVLTCGGTPGRREIDLALGCELLDTFPDLLSQVADRPARTRDNLNNAFAVIAGDYLLAQAFKLISPLGAVRVARLAECATTVCEGAMSECGEGRREAVDPDWPLTAAYMRSATLYSVACQLGGELAGADAATADALAAFGRTVGMALRIAADIRLLRTGCQAEDDDAFTTKTSNVGVRLALSQSPALNDAIQDAQRDADPISLTTILSTSGLAEAAVQLCESYAAQAKDALHALADRDSSLLHDIADLAVRWCRQAVSGVCADSARYAIARGAAR